MQAFLDEPLTLSPEEQTGLNVARWTELIMDPQWEQWEGRIETDEYGNVIMLPLCAPIHGRAVVQILILLKQLLEGVAIIECPISTAKGVKGADVAWMSNEAWEKERNKPCLATAP